MPPRNATSDYMASDNYERLQELQDAMEELAAEGKRFSIEYIRTQREFNKELRKTSKEFNDRFEKNTHTLTRAFDGFISSIDRTIESYVRSIENLSYSLNGNLRGYSDITSNLNKVLNNQNLVKQTDAFNNLTKIIHSGIINNAEQKAFLQTLSDDLGMEFKVSNDTMRQLIRIQGEDSTANRMAIEYSLNEFLVQNYQTGEYIRNGFTQVSNALLQSQSTMTSAMAASYESTIQTWMGSLYSVGLDQNTISSLAKAIDAVGSGNIQGLGQGISNLVLMGAARAGLDYGELLNRGFQGNEVNQLMQGITGYISEMSNNSSNVVMNQLGNLFGLQMSDIMALRNNGLNISGGANANSSAMLNSVSSLIPGVTRLMNGIANFEYGWGANIASNENTLLAYETARRFIEPLGGLISGVGGLLSGIPVVGSTIGGVSNALGTVASYSPLIVAALANLGQGNLKNLFTGDLLSGIINSKNGANAYNIWEALGTGGDGINNTTVVTSTSGVSGSIGISRNGGGGLLNNIRNSLADLGIEETTTGDEVTVDEHINNIDNGVTSMISLLTDIKESMSSSSSSPTFDYGGRSGGIIYGR